MTVDLGEQKRILEKTKASDTDLSGRSTAPTAQEAVDWRAVAQPMAEDQ
jgi:hypothetical protein